MALDPVTLLAPQGQLSLAIVKSADPRAKGRKAAEVVIGEYLDAAYDEPRVASLANTTASEIARHDHAARAFTYYRVYSDAYQAMLDRPASLTVTEKGGHAYSSEQLKGMKALVDAALAEFEGLVEPEVETVPPRVRKVAVRTFVSF